MPHGKIELIVGCMSSGKSEQLIGRLRRISIAKKAVVLFKPGQDTRTDSCTVASRDGKRHVAIAVNSADEILERVRGLDNVAAIGIDEIQFFDLSLLPVVMELARPEKRVVILSGLDADFRGNHFEITRRLMVLADRVDRLDAVCMVCGGNATFSQRLIDGRPAPQDSPTIVVGGDDMYEARCRDCYVSPQ